MDNCYGPIIGNIVLYNNQCVPKYVDMSEVKGVKNINNMKRMESVINTAIHNYLKSPQMQMDSILLNRTNSDPNFLYTNPAAMYVCTIPVPPKTADKKKIKTPKRSTAKPVGYHLKRYRDKDLLAQWNFKGFTGD